ncbi:S46 family peptidase [candidate division KSB1 bacterium]|nr:S46 family peptidase [candidate division KSB1 bacterium]
MRSKICAIIFLLVIFSINLVADEGMWTFDNPPTERLQQRYDFTPTDEWLEHVRLASVRFMDGGSGSFVSPNGLVLTNHHVAMGQLSKLSTAENNLVATGFYAEMFKDELKCPDLEVNILVAMADVTAEVKGVVTSEMSDQEALKARKAKIAEIEQERKEKTGLQYDVVNLYHGGEYWAYGYRKYTDVRLVMAPERLAAYFGGDLDNFTYPRYDLDMAFFRVYENDEPLKSENYLKWNAKGAGKDELVFISGNPGSTDRLYTYPQLEFQRDYRYPMLLKYIHKRLEILRDYAGKGAEEQRRALGQIFGLENADKALTGELQGLMNEELMATKKKEEAEFRQKVASNSEWQDEYGDAWENIAELIGKREDFAHERFYANLRGSSLARIARQIVRYVTEIQKPDAERLEGYHKSELERRKFYMLSPAPVYKDLEEAVLLGTLKMSIDVLGEDHEFVKIILNGKTPEEVVKNLFENTKLDQIEVRKNLMEGGEEAVKKSKDPMIVLARELDPYLREQEKWYRENIESKLTPATERIAQARFEVYGKNMYPDATFTLRLGYGAVKGYPYNGTRAPYKTTMYGLYDRSLSFNREEPFSLPDRFWERQDQLDLSTAVNFVCTCDAVGGNSGSPVFNRDAELVGVLFDGNIESLPGRFIYDETKNRSVCVHAAYMTEALRKLYDAGKLADELEGVE